MIGFNHLGQHGRLGNQMFQYAALRGIANIHNYKFCIPESNFNNQWADHQLFEAFELPNLKTKKVLSDNSSNYYQEQQFHYDENYVRNCPDDVSLYGYFQSEKYFSHIEESIREDFTFKSEILTPCKEEFNYDNIISLHIRRTDFVTSSNEHPPCSLDYYKKALSEFDDDIPVMIFSDDQIWCESQELFNSDRFIFSENTWNLIDLCLMSLCSYHIIANSSFSWWGSWLARSKKTVAPKIWFGNNGLTSQHNTKDIYVNDWIII